MLHRSESLGLEAGAMSFSNRLSSQSLGVSDSLGPGTVLASMSGFLSVIRPVLTVRRDGIGVQASAAPAQDPRI